jgi:hypothetical protein
MRQRTTNVDKVGLTRDSGDWKLHDYWFDKIQQDWVLSGRRAFQIDTAADERGSNSFLPKFCSKRRPFEEQWDITLGRSLWANPDFRKIRQYITHFAKLKATNSMTQMCLITPLDNTRPWWRLIHKYFQKEVIIPRDWKTSDGQRVFSRPNDIGGRECPGPAPFDVCVWFSKVPAAK